ncbi:MAG TPA: nucleotidyltransferase family protein [Gemmatimonadaceae bacterium]|nr:nucleotidyltransferase family protein [Gemmatimonadaceae bacterium]
MPPSRAMEELIRLEGASGWLYRRWRDAGSGEASVGRLHSAVRIHALAEMGGTLTVESAAAEALGILAQAGIEVVLLKGLAYRAAAQTYPYLDARSTNDIDVLVAPSDANTAWQALRRAAFVPIPASAFQKPSDHHHLGGLASSLGVTIELHTSTSPTRPAHEAWKSIRGNAERKDWNGMSVLIPSATEMLWHAVEHSFTHGAAGFRLRQFLPGAALLAARAPVDVDLIQLRATAGRVREDGNREVSAEAVRQWLAMAGALAGPHSLATPWQGGYDRLWRLLTWRFVLLRQLPTGSRLKPYLFEQGTRAEIGLRPVYSTLHPSLTHRARYRTLASFSRLAYMLLRPRRRH